MRNRIIAFIGILVFALACYGIYNMFDNLINGQAEVDGTAPNQTSPQSGSTTYSPGGEALNSDQTSTTGIPNQTSETPSDTETTASETGDNDIVKFENSILADYISEELSKPVSKITYSDLKMIDTIEINSVKSQNLTINDLKYVTNLSNLRIFNAPLKSAEQLKGLKALKHLELVNCELTDISGLSELKALEFLNLSYNKITSVEPLHALTSLTILHLNNNDITDLNPIGEIPNLQKLYARSNEIISISFVSNLKNLIVLDLSQNEITDAEPLKSLVKLETLTLSDNKIADAAPLTGLTGLHSLSIRNNPNIKNSQTLMSLSKQLVFFDADFTLKPMTGKLGNPNPDESITAGNHVNGASVNTDGSYLYYMYIPVVDIELPTLMRWNLKTFEEQPLSGQVNEQLASLYTWAPGSQLTEYLNYLNISNGQLYYCVQGYNTITAEPTESGFSMGHTFEGIVSMKADGSDRKLLKKGVYKNLIVKDNLIYYMNESGKVRSMRIDGSLDQQVLDDSVDYFYPVLNGMFLLKNNDLYMYRSNTNSTEQIISGCKKFILSGDFIYFIDIDGYVNKFDMSTWQQQRLGNAKAGTFNISEKYIFYSNRNDSERLYRMNLDGSSPALVRKSPAKSIAVLGDYVFIKSSGEIDASIEMMKFDGSEYEMFEKQF